MRGLDLVLGRKLPAPCKHDDILPPQHEARADRCLQPLGNLRRAGRVSAQCEACALDTGEEGVRLPTGAQMTDFVGKLCHRDPSARTWRLKDAVSLR